jgi:hypothetical protein
MIEDTVRIVNEAIRDKIQVNLIIRDCSEKTYKSLKSMEKHSNF